MPRISYRPDAYNNGRYAVIKVVDGVPEEVETHHDKDYIARRAGELNREVILTTLFPDSYNAKLEPIIIAARKLTEEVLLNTPKSADQSTAVRSIREAVLWAQQAIALEGYA